jgi:hydroxypyruvate reductase
LNIPDDLRRAARSIFDATLADMDARAAVRRALDFTDGRLTILDTEFDLDAQPLAIYCVAAGKAAGAMAAAVDEVLGDALTGGVVSAPSAAGVVSAPRAGVALSARWRVYAGGHPLPDEASTDAARAAFALLREADAAAMMRAEADTGARAEADDNEARVEIDENETRSLVIFLISGGGSAMLEWPRDESITLAELRVANRVLVTCGAGIDEINCVRRALSTVKGGGLSARASRAAQISLIISDTKPGEPHNVASGPTYPFPHDPHDPAEVIKRYRLAARLPASILRAVMQPPQAHTESGRATALRRHHVLLDNERALVRAAEAAAALGFAVEIARDISDQEVEAGAAQLVARLFDLRGREGGRPACLISGGEFSCPVRGAGVGGRNAETALRCAFEIEARAARSPSATAAAPRVVALSAGTDGIDGNSPAAGALADDTTLARARLRSLDARKFLAASDAHTLFAALGDAVNTGATGTNVRDLRLLLSGNQT